MKFATLGLDADVLHFTESIARHTNDEIAGCFDAGGSLSTLRQLAPKAMFDESWEVLLSGSVADAVIVSARPLDAAAREQRDHQLRKIAQAGLDAILVQPACDMILSFELQMIRSDTRSVLVPFHVAFYEPHLLQLRDWVQDAASCPVGKIEQLQIERSGRARQNSIVLHEFAKDTSLIRFLLVDDITQVSAMGASDDEYHYQNLGVMLKTRGQHMVSWNLRPSGEEGAIDLHAVGETGTITLAIPSGGERCTWRSSAADLAPPAKNPVDPYLAAIEDFRSAREQRADANLDELWESACRSLELEEAVDRSMRRGRTIELYQERVTEQDTFKSVMAAGGCGMLLWVMFLLLVAGVIEGLQLPIRDTAVWQFWPAFLFVPLVVFLLLQTLQFVYVKSERHDSRATP